MVISPGGPAYKHHSQYDMCGVVVTASAFGVGDPGSIPAMLLLFRALAKILQVDW